MVLRGFKDAIAFKNPGRGQWIIVLSVFFLINLPAVIKDNGHSNAYVLLAKSFCRGTLSLSTKDMADIKGTSIKDNGDLTYFDEKYYLPYPPAPAVIIIPFLFVNYSFVNSVLICVLLSCLNIILLFKILSKLDIKYPDKAWLMYAFFFGTCYWSVLETASHVYGFAEIVSVTSIFLMLNELFGKARGSLVGFFLGLAFLSRQFTIVLSVFVLGFYINQYLISDRIDKFQFLRKKVLYFCAALGACVMLYLLYNYLRFKDPLQTGYKYILFGGILKYRVEQFGVFSPHYFFYNLYNYLIKGFNIYFTGPGLMKIQDVDPFGTGLLIASPFLVAAFKTNCGKVFKIFAWIAIALIFTGMLFYHNNGKDQINSSRFTLDFLPILFILMAFGIRSVPPWLMKGMIVYAIVLNVIAFSIHGLYHSFL